MKNPEVELILSIMNKGTGMSYSWSGKETDLGVITDSSTGRRYKVDSQNYEIAYCINELLTTKFDTVLKVISLLMDI